MEPEIQKEVDRAVGFLKRIGYEHVMVGHYDGVWSVVTITIKAGCNIDLQRIIHRDLDDVLNMIKGSKKAPHHRQVRG